MTAPDTWLARPETDMPASLAESMRGYLDRHATGALPDRLARAGLDALRVALQRPAERVSAIDLLAADALLTAAFEAAAEEGVTAVDHLAAATVPAAFAELLTEQP